jgi:hypothetical protein
MMWLVALCFVWAGMVLGISFLETPVKFTAPSVTLLIGLDVGRHVFGMMNKVEIAAALLACILIVLARAERAVWLPLATSVIIVALQTVWLLPILDARVEILLNGRTPADASYHIIYIGLELLKVIGLIASGVAGLFVLKRAASPPEYSRERNAGLSLVGEK